MNAQREGSNLKVEIRICLSVLGRDANEIDTRRMSLAELRETLRQLRAEYLASKAAWEDEGLRAWFKERCEQPGNRDLCPAARGEWYIGHDCHTRCKLCELKAT